MILLQINLTQTLQDMLATFASVVPRVLSALVIFIVGYIISKIVAKILRKALKKVGVDKIGEKLERIDIVQKTNMKIEISAMIAKAIYYFMMLFFLVAATSALGIPEVSALVADIFAFVPNLLVAVIILILGTLLADVLRNIVQTALKSLGVPSANLIASVLFYFLFINIIVSAMSQAKINTEFLSQNISILIGGVVAAFAIGYGLASKDVMANLIASFYSKKQFEVGQKITIDGHSGVVSAVDTQTLTLTTDEGSVRFPISHALRSTVIFNS